MDEEYLIVRKLLFDQVQLLLHAGIRRYLDVAYFQLDDINYLYTVICRLIETTELVMVRYYNREYHGAILQYLGKLYTYKYITGNIQRELFAFKEVENDIYHHFKDGVVLLDYNDFILMHYKYVTEHYETYVKANLVPTQAPAICLPACPGSLGTPIC